MTKRIIDRFRSANPIAQAAIVAAAGALWLAAALATGTLQAVLAYLAGAL